jgi:hypothetical protein
MSVPLICAGPGITANQIVRAPITTLDLAATFIGRQTAFFAPINS